MRLLGQSILLLLLLSASVLVLAPFSERGSHTLVKLVQKYSPLDIVYAGGSLGGELQLERLALRNASLEIELVDVRSQLRLSCLWRSAFCFEQLQAASLDIYVPPAEVDEVGNDESLSQPFETTLIEFPVTVAADSLTIATTRIHWPGGEWRQGLAQLHVEISNSTVAIHRAVLHTPTLTLREFSQDNAASPAQISLPRIDLPLVLAVDELLLLQPSWDFYGSKTQQEKLRLAGEWRNTQLQLQQLSAETAQWGNAALSGQIAFHADWPLRVQSALTLANAGDSQFLAGREFVLDVEGDLSALQLQLLAPGEPLLSAQAQLNSLHPNLPFQASAELSWPQGFAVTDIPGAPLQLQGLLLDTPLHGTFSGTREQQSIDLSAGVSGLGYSSLNLVVSAIHQQGRIGLRELSLRNASGTNSLSASGELTLADGDAGGLALEVTSAGLSLPQVSELISGRLEGSFAANVRWSPQQWRVALSDLALLGDINNLPASISGQFRLDNDWRLSGSDLQAAINGAQLVLRAPEAGVSSGQLMLDIADLGRWQPGAEGQLQLQADATANLAGLSYRGNVQDINWGGMQLEDGEFSGAYTLEKQRFTIAGSLNRLRVGQMALTSLTLAASGDESAQDAVLSVQGDIIGELHVRGGGSDRNWQGKLAATELLTPHGNWVLADSVDMAWLPDSAQLQVASHCWRRERSSICPGQLIVGGQGSGSIDATGDLAYLESLLAPGMDLQGDITLQLEGSWGTQLQLQGSASTGPLVVARHYGDGESASAHWDRGKLDLNYGEQGLQLKGNLQRAQRAVLALDVILPLDRQKPLRGDVSVDRLQLAPLIAFMPMLSQLDGEVSGELQLSGSADKPQTSGQLRLRQGQLALVGNPTALNKMELDVDFLGASAKLRGAGLLGGGKVRLQGDMLLQPELSVDLLVEGERQNILYPPATALLLSEQLRIVASPGLLSVTGDITINEGSLEPEVLPEGSVAVSADVVEVDYAGRVISEQLPFDVNIDVRILVEDKFSVRSSVLFATLGGELQVLQRPGQPLQLFGNLRIVGGELRAYQQQLKIRRGTFSFTGRPDNPTVNVRAERAISGSNVTVGMQVRGTYDALVLEVFSEPAMSQGEAMSYLVRGRGQDASSGEDGTAMALTLASGVLNRSTLISELNRIPGVNNVSFGAEGTEEDTAATVGGYIGDRIYLSYGVGVYEPINVLIARLYLSTRLWIEVVSRLENSVDLYYAFDID